MPDDGKAIRSERRQARPRPKRDEQHPTGLPIIRIAAGELHTITSAAEEAILKADVPIYQRGRVLVRPATLEVPASDGRTIFAAGLSNMSVPAVIDVLCAVAQWEKYDARSEDFVRTNPPKQVAEILLSRFGHWRLSSIAGIVTTPTMRPDGSILSAPGYDAATRLYHVVDPMLRLGPEVERPTREDAIQALGLLKDDLLNEFPFVNEVSIAVALSGLITPVVRGALPVAPMHVFRAPTPGSGKSYLADVASTIATGRECPVITAPKNDEAEMEKRLVGLLTAGFPIISLDNVNGELGGDLLCQAIERPLVAARRLGKNDIIEIESKATILGTGNNLRVRGDMVRRVLVAELDPGVERPEERHFKGDPVATVIADRGRYVSACLVIVRAYLIAGSPDRLSALASFGAWSALVRSALVWLGSADPVLSMQTARDDDPELGEMREVMSAWHGMFRDESKTARQAAEDAAALKPLPDANGDIPSQGARMVPRNPELQDALLRVANVRGAINSKKLGDWLSAHQGRIVAVDDPPVRRCFRRDGATGGSMRWKLSST